MAIVSTNTTLPEAASSATLNCSPVVTSVSVATAHGWLKVAWAGVGRSVGVMVGTPDGVGTLLPEGGGAAGVIVGSAVGEVVALTVGVGAGGAAEPAQPAETARTMSSGRPSRVCGMRPCSPMGVTRA
jgi:hypothetical protein